MNIRQMILSEPGMGFAPEMYAELERMQAQMQALCGESGDMEEGLLRIVNSGGKRLRPLLAWVCWNLCGGEMPVLPLMCMLEMMHTASLIHDDYIDDAPSRRGVRTIHAVYGAIAAVRSGDYLLASAMELLEHYRGTGINEALSAVSQEMCLGELEQRAGLFHLRGTDEARYYDRIRKKTALLMAESCAAGAVSGGGEERTVHALQKYGEHLGLAFQIRDDYLDCFGKQTGKDALQDLKSGVITLPILYAAQELGEDFVCAVELQEKDDETLCRIRHWLKKTAAKEKTMEKLKTECEIACRKLELLPDSPEKSALALLAQSLWEVKDLV